MNVYNSLITSNDYKYSFQIYFISGNFLFNFGRNYQSIPGIIYEGLYLLIIIKYIHYILKSKLFYFLIKKVNLRIIRAH